MWAIELIWRSPICKRLQSSFIFMIQDIIGWISQGNALTCKDNLGPWNYRRYSRLPSFMLQRGEEGSYLNQGPVKN
jgi:hypothetical protein